MSDSNRHGYITFGWVATIIGVLLFFGFNSSYYANAQKSAEYARKCADQYQNLSSPPSGSNATTGEEIEPAGTKENQAYPDWCDLAAQQSMAESTYWMNWAAIATTIFTGIGAFLIWQTLLATQDTLAETRRIGEAQTTPFLTISFDDGSHVERDGDAWKFKHPQNDIFFRLQNSGSSPAIVTRLFRCWDFTPECNGQPAPVDPDAVPNGYGMMKSNSVAIGGNAKSTKIHTFFEIDRLHARTHERRAHRAYFIGFVDYESVGGEKFRLGFCCILHHGYLELAWPTHNAGKYNYNKKLNT